MKRFKDWYRHPKYYEAIFGTDTAREMDFLDVVNQSHGNGGNTFLEPACGAGRLIQEGAGRGHVMVGYDVSEEMLAFAEARLSPSQKRRVHLYRDRMETFCPKRWQGRVDLAFSLVSTFRYLESEEAALAHLKATRRLLRPDGLYVLGFHLTDYARRGYEHERWVEHVGSERVVCNTREWPPDRRARRTRMRNRLRIEGAEGAFVIETEWFFRTWSDVEAEALFEKSGFELVGLYTFECDPSAPIGWDSNRLDRVMVLAPK